MNSEDSSHQVERDAGESPAILNEGDEEEGGAGKQVAKEEEERDGEEDEEEEEEEQGEVDDDEDADDEEIDNDDDEEGEEGDDADDDEEEGDDDDSDDCSSSDDDDDPDAFWEKIDRKRNGEEARELLKGLKSNDRQFECLDLIDCWGVLDYFMHGVRCMGLSGRSQFVDALRQNTVIETIKFHFDPKIFGSQWPGGNHEQVDLCETIGKAFGQIKCLKSLIIDCNTEFPEDSYLTIWAIPILLQQIKQISSFEVRMHPTDDDDYIYPLDEGLKSHPSLENVHVVFYGQNDMVSPGQRRPPVPVRNPFPTAFVTLPNLKSIKFSTTQSFDTPIMQPTLTNLCPPASMSEQMSKSFEKLSLQGFTHDTSSQTDVAKMVQKYEIKVLEIDHCRYVGGGLDTFVPDVAFSGNLQCLCITVPENPPKSFYAHLVTALRKNTSLNILDLSCTILENATDISDHVNGIESILAALIDLDSIGELLLRYFVWESKEKLCETLQKYLRSTKKLYSISIISFLKGDHSLHYDGTFKDNACRCVFAALAENKNGNVERVVLKGSMTGQGLIEGVSLLCDAKNKSLEVLDVDFWDFTEIGTAVTGCLELICGSDLPIHKFNVENAVLSLQDGKIVAKAIEKSFHLARFQMELSPNLGDHEAWSDDEAYYVEKQVSTIVRLNSWGREYLIHNGVDGDEIERSRADTVNKGITLLSKVSDDLDCIYFHLRENPSLCSIKDKSSKNHSKEFQARLTNCGLTPSKRKAE